MIYDITIHWDGKHINIYPGVPSENNLQAGSMDEFTLGADKARVWLVNIEVAPDQLQDYLRLALK